MTVLTPDQITEYICGHYINTVEIRSWGERSLFYNPHRLLPRGIYFATLKEHDGPNDSASNLNRPGIFRLNIGISKPTFQRLFGALPTRPRAGGVVQTGHDFQQLDTLIPHPVYGWMAWIAILSPRLDTFEVVKPLLTEAYTLAAQKFEKRKPKQA